MSRSKRPPRTDGHMCSICNPAREAKAPVRDLRESEAHRVDTVQGEQCEWYGCDFDGWDDLDTEPMAPTTPGPLRVPLAELDSERRRPDRPVLARFRELAAKVSEPPTSLLACGHKPPTLTDRRAALGFPVLSAEERRRNLAEYLQDARNYVRDDSEPE